MVFTYGVSGRKLKDSIFGTDEFEALNRYAKAKVIMERPEKLEDLTHGALEVCTNILLRSMCYCRFIEIVIDESTDPPTEILVERSAKNLVHDRTCPVARNPVNEDLDPKQLLRHQRLEVLCDHAHLLMIEEASYEATTGKTP